MNQTKKRLQIINLAISIGDMETIQLQTLKLAPLKSDENIQEILKGLRQENYAQTQALISDYIENAPEEVIQRTVQDDILTQEEEEAIIEEFDLFIVPEEEKEEKVEEILDLNTFKEQKSESFPQKEEIDFDTLLNLKGDDILKENINISHTQLEKDDFFEQQEPTRYDYTEVIDKDDSFFQELPPVQDLSTVKENDTHNDLPPVKQVVPEVDPTDTAPKQNRNERPESASEYEAITYIDQKYEDLKEQYPPIEPTSKLYPSAKAWLLKIRKLGYSESEIEEMMVYIQKRTKEGKIAEAVQLLLISGATHSLFAQFMLARALFKGDILQKNTDAAFKHFYSLAVESSYPEAICDLAQLYEYGISTEKDLKEAERLYKEAMSLGIQRAIPHYERLHRKNRGLLGRLFRK